MPALHDLAPRSVLMLLVAIACAAGFFGCASLAPDKQPAIVKRVQAIYPRELLSNGIRGEAEVEFIVDSFGNVIEPVVVYASHPEFGHAAIVAIRGWQFTAGIKRGRAVAARLRQSFYFDFEPAP